MTALIRATLSVALLGSTLMARADVPRFEADVLPIFTKYCFNCHGKSSPQLGLDLRSARLVMRGSQNGAVIVPGSLERSLLWKKVSTREMPLELFKLKLKDEEIDTIRRWIEGGAPSDQKALPEDVRQQFARFENEVRPILTQHCVDCHSGDAPESGLDLSSLTSLVRGSEKGPVIYEGFSDKSVLIRKVASHAMPPPDAGDPLSEEQIRRITAWIDRGRFVDFVEVEPRRLPAGELDETVSEDARQFWAFQSPRDVVVPAVQRVDQVRTPIDLFVLARLESAGLHLSHSASRPTLVRRAYFDLTGLPPTPQEARAFLQDTRPDAYERLIDRLLASPHYGERWGRHWLDVVGYVDTTGKDFNPSGANLSPGYWRYRDYVIAATNEDVGWDRFLTEQIAGDELVDWRTADHYTPEMTRLLTATGFLRNVLDATDEDISNLPFDRYEALFKLMERVSSSTLGLTLACARCHSHKFDPIPQVDYYRFLSLFTSAYNPSSWLPPKQRFLHSVSQSGRAARDVRRNKASAKIAEAKKVIDAINAATRTRLEDERLKHQTDEVRQQVRAALQKAEKDRSATDKKLLAGIDGIPVTAADVTAALTDVDRTRRNDLRARVSRGEAQIAELQVGKIQALWDVGAPPTIRLLHRGDVDFAGPTVSPGFLQVLSRTDAASASPSVNAVGRTSGLRLAFAEWLTRPDHPLTARVIVNRIWQHHFGRGIVATPGNFGETGARPTHPDLLDWLAIDLMRHGWSAKRLHRLIMTSSVYRQASTRHQTNVSGDDADPEEVDPANQLLWRMNLRRLDAEALRDAVVKSTGQSDRAMGGAPVLLKATAAGLQTITDPSRRSVYLLARRSNPASFLRVFDYPVIDVNCTQRSQSATPLQSLTMMNSAFLATSAKELAKRIAGKSSSRDGQIEHAYWATLSRPPSPRERTLARSHMETLQSLLDEQPTNDAAQQSDALQNLVHMLLCCNEFLYVD